MKRFLALLLALLLGLPMGGCAPLLEAALSVVESELAAQAQAPEPASPAPPEAAGGVFVSPPAPSAPAPSPGPIEESGTYDSREDVSLYLYTYGRLPANFITKSEARALGWEGGSLKPYAPGKCIGGDRFGNYEGLLPEAPGRAYFECDINTLAKSSRGAQRIVFSSDGLIYYTGDHYDSFELLYGEE